jgi:hypothetical protein
MKRKYFVAFDYWKSDGRHGIASTVIEREFPVSGWDDILSMSDVILSYDSDFTKVVISNWRRFEDSE